MRDLIVEPSCFSSDSTYNGHLKWLAKRLYNSNFILQREDGILTFIFQQDNIIISFIENDKITSIKEMDYKDFIPDSLLKQVKTIEDLPVRLSLVCNNMDNLRDELKDDLLIGEVRSGKNNRISWPKYNINFKFIWNNYQLQYSK